MKIIINWNQIDNFLKYVDNFQNYMFINVFILIVKTML